MCASDQVCTVHHMCSRFAYLGKVYVHQVCTVHHMCTRFAYLGKVYVHQIRCALCTICAPGLLI